MKRLIILALALLCVVPTYAQQLKTSYGITTVTTVEKTKKTIADIEPGFEQSVEVGGFYTISDDFFFLGANYIAGYRFNRTFFVGGGVGFEYKLNVGYNQLTMPIFAHARAYIGKGRWQPFFGLSVGGRICLSSHDVGYYCAKRFGAYLNPSFGVNCAINNKLGVNIRVGWQIINVENNYGTVVASYVEHGPAFNIGLTF